MQSSVIDNPDPLTTAPPTGSSGLRDKLLAVLGDVRVPAALASIVLSAWCLFLDNVVNNDGILYLRTAELLSRGEWQTALGLYKWPFYALLISVVSQITSLSFEYSAHVLNAGLTALTVVTFLTLIRELGGDRRTIVAAAFVVLLYPGLNEYRSFVIRDTGYIAFYLLSLLLFIKTLRAPHWGPTIGWIVAMFVASLFRIEGFVFLLMLPFIQQLRRSAAIATKIRLFTMATSLVSFFLLITVAWWIFGNVGMVSPTTVGPKLAALLETLWQNTNASISAKTAIIAGQLPDKYSREFAYAVFIAALAMILLAETLARLTPLYAVLTCHALYRRLVFPVQGVKAIWLWLIILNLCILAMFVLVRLFLTGRFPLALSLTVMLAVPFSLVVLHGAWRDSRAKSKVRNWSFPVVCVLILLFGLDGLYSPTKKTYLKEAGIWLRDNTPAQSTLLTNNQVLMFYAARNVYSDAGRFLPSHGLDFIRSNEWQEYDYLAVRIKNKQKKQKASVVGTLGRNPVMRFANRKGDEVLIFKVH